MNLECPFCGTIYFIEKGTQAKTWKCRTCRAVLISPAGSRRRKLITISLFVFGGSLLTFLSVFLAFKLANNQQQPQQMARVEINVPVLQKRLPELEQYAGGVISFAKRREEIETKLRNEFGQDIFGYVDDEPFIIAYEKGKELDSQGVLLYMQILKQHYAFFQQDFQELRLKTPDVPLLVIIFSNQSSYADYCRKKRIQTFNIIPSFYESKQRRVICHYQAALPNQLRTLLMHESTHMLVDYYTRARGSEGTAASFWFYEGTASYYEGFTVDDSAGKVVVKRSIDQSRLQYAKEAFTDSQEKLELSYIINMNVDGFWDWVNNETISPEYRKRRAQLFYGASWAITYYLVTTLERQSFIKYADLELSGKGGRAAFDACICEGKPLEETSQKIINFSLSLK